MIKKRRKKQSHRLPNIKCGKAMHQKNRGIK